MNIIVILLLLTTVEQFAVDVYLPSLPAMTDYFSVDNAYLQMTLSLYLLGFALSPILFGPLTDYYGRRKILMSGLIIFVLASLVCSMTSSITLLLLARLCQGIGSGAIVVANQSMVRDSFSGKQLAIVASYMSITWSLVPIISPAIGGYLQHYLGWRANFWVITLYGILALMIILKLLPETMKSRPVRLDIKLIIKRYLKFLLNKHFMTYVACTAITFAITIAFNTAAPFIFQQGLGLSPVNFGWLALAVGMSYLLGTLLNRYLLRFATPSQLLILGQVLMIGFGLLMVGLALLGYFSVLSVSIPASGIIFAEGLVYPNAAALAFDPITKHTGIASALYGGIQLLACALTSAFVAQLPDVSPIPLACTMLGLSLLLSSLYFLRRLFD